MESDVINLYQRLIGIHKSKIDAVTFIDNATINQAIQSRLLQFLVNKNFVKLRSPCSAKPELLSYSDDQMADCLDDKSLYFKIDGYSSQTALLKSNFNEYIKFWVFWFAIFIALLKFWGLSKITATTPGSIIYGCLEGFNRTEKDFQRVEQFLKTTTISGLKDSHVFMLKGRKFIQQLSPDILGAKFPEVAFVYHAKLTFMGRVEAVISHLFHAVKYHFLWFKFPVLLGIASEFSFVHIALKLEQMELLKAYVFSTSNMTTHQLSTQLNVSAHQHYLYYNVVPTNPVHKSDNAPHQATLEPFMLFPYSGTHWVWSENDAELMKKHYKQANVKVGGIPAMFYEKQNKLNKKTKPEFDIVIFDVTPMHLNEHNPSSITYYYGRYETAIALINNIIEAASQASVKNGIPPLKIALKPKRKNQYHHDMRYWRDIEERENNNENFTILDESQNIFGLFHPDTIVINRPFTSTAQLAAMHGCVSIYHDPNEEIIDTSIKIENLFYSSGQQSLTELLCQMTKTSPDAPQN